MSWYLETDHLLAADQRWFSLRYRRFYYEDIRSIVIWRTHALWIWLAIEGALGGLFIWVAWLRQATATAGILAAATVALLAAEVAAGHHAQARIETLYSTYRAPLVRRWRQGRPALARLETRLPIPARTAVE